MNEHLDICRQLPPKAQEAGVGSVPFLKTKTARESFGQFARLVIPNIPRKISHFFGYQTLGRVPCPQRAAGVAPGCAGLQTIARTRRSRCDNRVHARMPESQVSVRSMLRAANTTAALACCGAPRADC